MLLKLFISLIIFIVISFCDCFTIVNFQPEQIHIAFGDNINYNLSITWSTLNYTNQSIVQYGLKSDDEMRFIEYGSSTLFVDGGPEKRSQYIHRVYLKNLVPNTAYVYHCGSYLGWSAEYRFYTTPSGHDWSPRFVIYGDLGNEDSVSLPLLQQYAQAGYMDAVVHLGDFAYNWEDDNGRVGDAFMNQIEPIAAYVPYMTVVGNHESAYNFSHYRERFTMPGDTENFYYSFDQGPIHFIVISTEHYFYPELKSSLHYHHNWLVNDLKKAQENRDIRPWIVVLGHRPMYCTNRRMPGCVNNETAIRTGALNKTTPYALESLFHEFNVDLAMWGHEHAYVRFWPVFDYEVFNGTYDEPYVNPTATINVISGAPGSKYEDLKTPKLNIVAYRTREYSFTVLQAFNKTHLYFEQVSGVNGIVLDSALIMKDPLSEDFSAINEIPDSLLAVWET